jgi:magnesium chelatase family protein
MSRLPGPLLDRIDIHIDVPALTYEEIASKEASGQSGAEIRTIVQEARNRQHARYNGRPTCNANLDSKAIREHCAVTESAGQLLGSVMNELGLSARAYDKVLRVARTIADIEGTAGISDAHIGEAVQYRSLDRQLL